MKFSQLKALCHHDNLAVSVELRIQGYSAVGGDSQIPSCPGCSLVEPADNLGSSRGKGKKLEHRIALGSFVRSADEINALRTYSPVITRLVGNEFFRTTIGKINALRPYTPVVTRLAGDEFFQPTRAGRSPDLTRLPISAFAVINKFAI